MTLRECTLNLTQGFRIVCWFSDVPIVTSVLHVATRYPRELQLLLSPRAILKKKQQPRKYFILLVVSVVGQQEMLASQTGVMVKKVPLLQPFGTFLKITFGRGCLLEKDYWIQFEIQFGFKHKIKMQPFISNY